MNSDSETTWRELVAAALLGTERRPVALASIGTADAALASVIAPLARSEAEVGMLGIAAALSQYRRAGYTAAPATDRLPASSEADTLQPASLQSRSQLTQMLSGQHRDLLSEWLALAAAAQISAPPQHLAALLDLGSSQPAFRSLITPVLGSRGRWLAGYNQAWQYALPTANLFALLTEAELVAEWQSADHATRMALLTTTRQHNAAHARTLLATTWAQEKASDRAAFLETLAVGLSSADEPLLEAALDDRAKDVRQTAAGLLLKLPESALSQRLWARAQQHLALKKRMLRTPIVEATLPAGYDSAMQRDGVEQKQHGALGEKASWLYHLIGMIPPSAWSEHWRSEPATLIAAAAQSEWQALLLGAWLVATTRHCDAAWAEALLASDALPVTAEVANLVAVLPIERREHYLSQLMREQAVGTPVLLRYCSHPWSEPFGRNVLDYFRNQISAGPRQPSWVMLTQVKESARYLPVSLAATSNQWPVDHSAWPSWQGAIDRMLVVLHFRAEMQRELQMTSSDVTK